RVYTKYLVESGLVARFRAPRAEGDLEAVGPPREGLRAGTRADCKRRSVGQVDETALDEVLRVHADAVAAHLSRRAVGVSVVHEPFSVGRRLSFGQSGGAHHPQDAVAADAEAAVAE